MSIPTLAGVPILLAGVLLPAAPTAAQDIRGMEVCTAEKQMERRTGCLQANVQFLHQELVRFTRESNGKLAAADRDLAGARAEIAALKAALARLESDMAHLRSKAAPAKPPAKK